MNKILNWIKDNVIKWTLFIAAMSFLIGPFLQSRSTKLLENIFPEESIYITGCSPVKNSLMVVSSSDGINKKIHSSKNAPFMTPSTFALVNKSNVIHNNVRIYLGFINEAENSLEATVFVTNNNVDGKNYKTIYNNNGSFNLEIGNLYPKDHIYITIFSMYTTAAYIDVRSEQTNKTKLINPGDCETDINKLGSVRPFYFYRNSNFPSPKITPPFVIDDINEPLGGNIKVERVFHYNCGEGMRTKIVPSIPYAETFELCGQIFEAAGPKKEAHKK